jgi:hypothetical protein
MAASAGIDVLANVDMATRMAAANATGFLPYWNRTGSGCKCLFCFATPWLIVPGTDVSSSKAIRSGSGAAKKEDDADFFFVFLVIVFDTNKEPATALVVLLVECGASVAAGTKAAFSCGRAMMRATRTVILLVVDGFIFPCFYTKETTGFDFVSGLA